MDVPTPKAGQAYIVVPAYIAVFLPWAVLSLFDFINDRWKPFCHVWRNGVLQLLVTIATSSYVLYYITLQAVAEEYTEMSAAIVAFILSMYHFLRTVWGMLQLHYLRKWLEKAITSISDNGYLKSIQTDYHNRFSNNSMEVNRVVANYVSDKADVPVYSVGEMASRFLLNNSVIDNEFVDTDVPVYLNVRSRATGSTAFIIPRRSRECFIRWAVPFITHFGYEWLRDSNNCQSLMYSPPDDRDHFTGRLCTQASWLAENECEVTATPVNERWAFMWVRIMLGLRVQAYVAAKRGASFMPFDELPPSELEDPFRRFHVLIRRIAEGIPGSLLESLTETQVDLFQSVSSLNLEHLIVFLHAHLVGEQGDIEQEPSNTIDSPIEGVGAPILTADIESPPVNTARTVSDSSVGVSDNTPQTHGRAYRSSWDHVFSSLPNRDCSVKVLMNTLKQCKRCAGERRRADANCHPTSQTLTKNVFSGEFHAIQLLEVVQLGYQKPRDVLSDSGHVRVARTTRANSWIGDYSWLKRTFAKVPPHLWRNQKVFELSAHIDNLLSLMRGATFSKNVKVPPFFKDIVEHGSLELRKSNFDSRLDALRETNRFFYRALREWTARTTAGEHIMLDHVMTMNFTGCVWKMMSAQLERLGLGTGNSNLQVNWEEELVVFPMSTLLKDVFNDDFEKDPLRAGQLWARQYFDNVLSEEMLYALHARLLWECQDYCFNWLRHAATYNIGSERERALHCAIMCVLSFPGVRMEIDINHRGINGFTLLAQGAPQACAVRIRVTIKHSLELHLYWNRGRDKEPVLNVNPLSGQNSPYGCTEACSNVYEMNLDYALEPDDNSMLTFRLNDWKAAAQGRLDAIRSHVTGSNENSSSMLRS